MTYLTVPISGHGAEGVHAACARAVAAGAGLIELRVDLMEGVSDEELRALREAINVPIILTIRSAAEGGNWDGDDNERLSRLIELSPVADYIDVELATWQRSANLRQKVVLALKRAAHVSQEGGREEIEHLGPRKLILSRHDFGGRPPRLHTDFLEMLGESACAVPKLAWQARTIRDNFEAFELMRQSPRPAIVICMGAFGLLSRVLAGKFGAFATFAACREGNETAAGQLPIEDMRELYHWDAINAQTGVYGVIGDPVGHSLSPRLHNAAFAEAGWNAIYLPLPVSAGYEPFKAFMSEVLARPWLDFRGTSVTIPHKENALRFLREIGGKIDTTAERIGAVNTLRLEPDGHLAGFNTDGPAAFEAVRTTLGNDNLSGRRAAILGAGGVARAVVAELVRSGAEVTIFNRTTERAKSMAEAFHCRYRPWAERENPDADLIVNCTNLGMWPQIKDSPLSGAALKPNMVVFDTVYRPLQTKLIRDAKDIGCRVIDGLQMFLLQARAQFQLWTGQFPEEQVYASFRSTQERTMNP